MSWIQRLIALSITSKLFNWFSHGAIVALLTLLFTAFGEPLLGVNIAFAIYLWRELENVFVRWAGTGKLSILQDNLGDLIGPIVVFVFVHLFV